MDFSSIDWDQCVFVFVVDLKKKNSGIAFFDLDIIFNGSPY